MASVWEQALTKINILEDLTSSSRLRSNSTVHTKINSMIKKYRHRYLLNKNDLLLLDELIAQVSKTAKTSVKKRKPTPVYNDLQNLLNMVKGIAENTPTRWSKAQEKSKIYDTVVDMDTGEIISFSYKDQNDMILDSMGYKAKTDTYTPKDERTKDLFFFGKGENSRSLAEEDIVSTTLSALREHLGERYFYDLLNTRTNSGKTLFEEINDRYVEFNLISDQPQGEFYALINAMLNQLKETSKNAGLFEQAKDVFIRANTYLSQHRDVTKTVDLFGTYISDDDYENILYEDF